MRTSAAALLETPVTGAPTPARRPRTRRPWDEIHVADDCRDLAAIELWELSLARSLARRQVAKEPPRLPKARRATVSLLVAAVAAAAPGKSSPHAGGTRGEAASSWERSLLRLGSRGDSVARLQRALRVPADGIFGPQTLRAVRAFQARHGLVADGVVGPRTSAALTSTRPRSGERMFRAPWVAPVQRALGIPADGIFGPQTRAAVRAFQARRDLVVDGIVGPQTLAALGLGGAARSASPSSHSRASSPSPGTRWGGAVAAARSAIGRPYAWGGTGPASFDCSGLVVWSFGRAGVASLPRTSHAQYMAGRAVSRSGIRAGDLVFFDTNGPGASHVGIAVSSSSFISATSHGVREQPIGGAYWGSHYVGARRLV